MIFLKIIILYYMINLENIGKYLFTASIIIINNMHNRLLYYNNTIINYSNNIQ